MKKVEAIVRHEKLDAVKEALNKRDIKGLTITQVVGCGHQKGQKKFYRGSVVDITLLPKIKIEIVAEDDQVDNIVNVILETGKTGEIGDGKIFVFDVENVYRIRTGESGSSAI